jgi:hypothetical protein
MPSSRGNQYQASNLCGMKCISPKSARRREVFPDPVGPTIRLSTPRLKKTSPSARRVKFRREGVTVPDLGLSVSEADQVKWALWKPIVSSEASVGLSPPDTEGAFAVYASSSSVYKESRQICNVWFAEDGIYISQEIYEDESEHATSKAVDGHTIHAVNADFARYHHWEILHHHVYRLTQ